MIALPPDFLWYRMPVNRRYGLRRPPKTALNQPQPFQPKSWVRAHVRRGEAFPRYGIQSLRGLVSRSRHSCQPRRCSPEGQERVRCSRSRFFQSTLRICSLIQPRLLQDRPFGLRVKVHRRVSCDCHGRRLRRMVVLAVTAFLPDLSPSVLLDQLDNVPDLQGTSVSGVDPKGQRESEKRIS